MRGSSTLARCTRSSTSSRDHVNALDGIPFVDNDLERRRARRIGPARSEPAGVGAHHARLTSRRLLGNRLVDWATADEPTVADPHSPARPSATCPPTSNLEGRSPTDAERYGDRTVRRQKTSAAGVERRGDCLERATAPGRRGPKRADQAALTDQEA